MLEREQVRFWAPVVAAAGFFPVLLLLTLVIWFIRSYIGLPATNTFIKVAAAPPVVLEEAAVEGAMSPPAPMAEPVAPLPEEQMSEAFTSAQVVAVRHSAYFDQNQGSSPVEIPVMAPEHPEPITPAAVLALPKAPRELPPGLPPLQPEPPGMAEPDVSPTDETVTEVVTTLPMLATFAVAPPTQFSRTNVELVPLPRPKPRVAPAAPQPPIRLLAPIETSPRPNSGRGQAAGLD